MMTPEGGLFESNAIARYVARQGDAKLLGTTNYENVRPNIMAISVWADSGCADLLYVMARQRYPINADLTPPELQNCAEHCLQHHIA